MIILTLGESDNEEYFSALFLKKKRLTTSYVIGVLGFNIIIQILFTIQGNIIPL